MSLPRMRTLLLSGVIGLVLLALATGLVVQHLLDAQGLHIERWSGTRVGLRGVSVATLELRREVAGEGRLELTLNELKLGWPEHADGRWRLREASAQAVNVRQWPAESPPAAVPSLDTGLPDPAQVARWLAWLPGQLQVRALSLELPCAQNQRCTLQGDLHWSQAPGNAAELAIGLHQGEHQLALGGQLQPREGAWQLNLDSDLDGERLASLQADWEPASRHWNGQLATPGVPPLQAVRDWLQPWLPIPTLPMSLPEAGRLRLGWDMRLAGEGAWPDWSGIRDGQGSAELTVQLPQPWPLPGLGSLQGDLQLAGVNAGPGWRPTLLSGDLRLTDLYGDWLQALPVGLRPASLRLGMEPGVDEEAGSVRLDLTSTGAANLRLRGRVALLDPPSWALEISDARLQGQVPHLQLGALAAETGRLDLSFSGRLEAQAAELALAPTSSLQLGSLAGPDGLKARTLAASLGQTAVHLGYAGGAPLQLGVSGPLKLSLGELREAHLKPLGWTYTGEWSAGLEQQALEGSLQNSGGLNASVRLTHRADALDVQAQLLSFFLRTGNPLGNTLADWPDLLSFANGKASLQGQWSLAANGTQRADLQLSGEGLDGVYDRSELHGVDIQAGLQLRGSTFNLEVGRLNAKALNPGVPLGPLSLQASYQGSLQAPLEGRLAWRQAELALFTGRAWLPPGQMDLARAEQDQHLTVQGVQLAEVLKAYPAEGLAGDGLIDGELPLRFDRQGLRIQGGQLATRGPGQLQFRSDKIRALGQSNPAMQLLASTLDDFRYDTLASTVDYDPAGKLLLGLSLSGRNPAVEQGRPINLNVNLEENIPKLLTSLQLSDRVSDLIRQRVQERLRQRPPAAP
ncbi:MAG: hypothetical protein GAK45_01467 [Pseudomonas citronellolis]|nr:MAG: hypothetical protein GAK45_01467 [Pseudomonas citronellolis]